MLLQHDLSPLPFNPKNYHFKQSSFQLIRPMTLTGTITPILVGTGLAALNDKIRLDLLIGLLIAAMLIQAATNMLNDYFDFKSGQDKNKWVIVQDKNTKHGPAYNTIPLCAGIMLAIATIIGFWLAVESSWIIIPIGTISILAGIAYSAGTHSFASLGLGEVIAFIFLGIVVTTLCYIVQDQPIHASIIVSALPFALLIASMILTNNIRDMKKDVPFRKTLAITLGKQRALTILRFFLFFAYLTIGLLVLFSILPNQTLLIFFALPVAIRLLYAFRQNASKVDELTAMKWAAIHHWVFGSLYVIGIWL